MKFKYIIGHTLSITLILIVTFWVIRLREANDPDRIVDILLGLIIIFGVFMFYGGWRFDILKLKPFVLYSTTIVLLFVFRILYKSFILGLP